MSSAGAGAAPPPHEDALPIFTRKSTGLVHDVSLANQLLFNAASTPLAGFAAIAWGLVAIFLVFCFHTNLGLLGGYYAATYIAPFAVWSVADIWWHSARAVRRREGIDLRLAYGTIPPA